MVMIGSRRGHLAIEACDTASAPAARGGGGTVGRWLLRLGSVLGVAALGGFLYGFADFASRLEVQEPAAAPRTDAIVVVTGGPQRIGDAINLLGADRGARLLISGVNEKTSREELAKLNPSARELLACCVDLDYRARNTIGNAIEARRWVRRHSFKSLLLVTSNYHMPRALAEFSHAMPNVRLVPHPVVTEHVDPSGWWSDWRTARLLLPEFAKYWAARLRSLVEDDPETSRLSVIVGGRKPISPKPASTLGPENERRSRLEAEARGA